MIPLYESARQVTRIGYFVIPILDPGQASVPDELLAHVYEIQSRMPALAKTHYITYVSLDVYVVITAIFIHTSLGAYANKCGSNYSSMETTRCLHAQQMGDYEIAIQSLYRFFDYCISMQDQVLYQYALLNLAMLHARFSNYDQALVVSTSPHRFEYEDPDNAVVWHS